MKRFKLISILNKINIKKIIIPFVILLLIALAIIGGAILDRTLGIKLLDKIKYFQKKTSVINLDKNILNEESIVISVTEEMSPSVVTVSVVAPKKRVFSIDPFGGFSQSIQGGEPQDIGTGFTVSEDGLIVTNKHVVSQKEATYKVITKDNKEYDVVSISRDPSNDIAVIKIDATGLKPLELGESDNLKVGQFVIAIGTALGEFRHTVTTGVISGLGRGITAGSIYEGYVEELNNVIQTDAAINYGNSGGPLLNSLGQVIGVNVAIASGVQNIGFAIPINTVKTALVQYEKDGKFTARAFLGVKYQMIGLQTAIMNKVPQGAYVTEVIKGSSADNAGVKVNDIITKFDGKDVSEKDGGLSKLVSEKKVGDKIDIEVWRDEENIKLTATLSESGDQ